MKIDLVYLWCDDRDANFRRKRLERMREFNLLRKREDGDKQDALRYKSYDELKYSLRSVNRYAPWIDKIYVVTNDQIPEWLNVANNRIRIIDHKQIMPADILPSFSSVAIEMYINKIPGLSENFIYSNDDVFIYREVMPNDFFDGNKPIVWVSGPSQKIRFSEIDALIDSEKNLWRRTLLRAWKMFVEKMNEKFLSLHQIILKILIQRRCLTMSLINTLSF